MRSKLVFLAVIVVFAGFFAVGGYMTYRDQRDGVPAVATVTDCVERLAKYGGDQCRGRWMLDGRVGEGLVEGVNHGDEGKRVEVRVVGDRAVVPGMRLSIVLWSIAGIIFVLGLYQLIKDARRPAGGGAAPSSA